jgi:hypothetical protein
MGQILPGYATTTEAVRRAIQHSQESLMVLAGRYGINPKTVAKWRSGEVAQAGACDGCPHGAKGSSLGGSEAGRRSGYCGISAFYTTAA